MEVVGTGMAEMHGKMTSGREVESAFKASEIKWFEDKWNTAVAQGTIEAPDRLGIDPKPRQLSPTSARRSRPPSSTGMAMPATSRSRAVRFLQWIKIADDDDVVRRALTTETHDPETDEHDFVFAQSPCIFPDAGTYEVGLDLAIGGRSATYRYPFVLDRRGTDRVRILYTRARCPIGRRP